MIWTYKHQQGQSTILSPLLGIRARLPESASSQQQQHRYDCHENARALYYIIHIPQQGRESQAKRTHTPLVTQASAPTPLSLSSLSQQPTVGNKTGKTGQRGAQLSTKTVERKAKQSQAKQSKKKPSKAK